MTRYNTGNPLGSTDPRDLYDNAENLDAGINGPAETWVDRLGQTRKSWDGIETDFQQFLADGSTIEFATWADASAAASGGQIPNNRQVAVIGDLGQHSDPVTGEVVPNQGRYIMTASGLLWRGPDVVSQKADNRTTQNSSGAIAILSTSSGDVMIGLDASGRRRVPMLSMSDGIEMNVRDDLDISGISSVTVKGSQVSSYQHYFGGTVDFNVPEDKNEQFSERSIGPFAHDKNKIYGAAFSQWVFPLFSSMNGRAYLSSVGNGSATPEYLGGLSINEKTGQSSWMQYEFAKQQFVQAGYQADDHNAPCSLLDPRPNARHPLMVFQSDHSAAGSKFRCWRSKTESSCGLSNPVVVSMAGNMSYAQAFRNPSNPDEIIAFSRQGGSSSAVWMIYRSTDEMETVHAARMIAGDDLYMMARPSIDGLGLHIAIQQHPENGVDQRVLYVYYRFSDSSLLNWDGSQVDANVFASPSFDPFSLSTPTTVYTPSVGRKKRLFDIVETSSGVVDLVLVDFIDSGVKPGTWKYVRLSSSGINTSQIGGDGAAGNPIESTANSYFGGISILGSYSAVAAAWNRVNNTGTLYKLASSDDGSSWAMDVIESSSGVNDKIIRPTANIEYFWSSSRIQWRINQRFVYLRGRYQLYLNFGLDAQEVNL